MKRNKSKPDSKDAASKNTFNPPDRAKKSQVEEPETLEQRVGQYTGQGIPSLQKK